MSETKPDWVKYFKIVSYEWSCPLCNHINKVSQEPSFRTIRCFKCGSYFDNVRDGGFLEKGNN